MPSTNKTTPYNLPQYLPKDFPSFTGEISDAFKIINDTMSSLNSSIGTAQAAAEAAQAAAEAAQAAAESAQQSANSANAAATNAVNLLVAIGVTNNETAADFKKKVDNAVPKYAILAEYFNSQV